MKKKREENVELADIQAVRERMTQWAIRLWLLCYVVITLTGAIVCGDKWFGRADPFEAYSVVASRLRGCWRGTGMCSPSTSRRTTSTSTAARR